jgi:hypothetical protein
MSFRRLLVIAVSVAACGPSRPTTDASSGGESSGSSEGSTTESTSAPAPSEPHGSTSDTTSDATGAIDSTGDTPESVCDPQPEPVVISLVVDAVEWQYEHEESDVVRECSVTSMTGDVASGARILLMCDGDGPRPSSHTLDIVAEPPIDLPIEIGMRTQFRMATFIPWWGDLYVTLRDEEGGLLLGYLSAGQVFSGCCGVEIDPSMFAPLTVTVKSDVCEPDCYESDSAGFISSHCPSCTYRRALELASPDDAVLVYDHGSNEVGHSERFAAIVEQARVYGNPDDPPNVGSSIHRTDGTSY